MLHHWKTALITACVGVLMTGGWFATDAAFGQYVGDKVDAKIGSRVGTLESKLDQLDDRQRLSVAAQAATQRDIKGLERSIEETNRNVRAMMRMMQADR